MAGYPDATVSGQPTVTAEPAAVSVAAGSGGSTQLQIQSSQPASVVQWQADPPAGVTVSPRSGIAVIAGGGQISISLEVSGTATLASGRYDVPITASANGQQVAETFLLVTSGSAVPSAIVLYAFGFSGVPLTSAASGVYEAADGSSDAAVQAESEQFAQYALAGTIPNESAAQPLGEINPANTCLGSPDVPVQ
ncbi:hypothetical protein [Actinospica sp.]|uniref:hypothetical protein n=1 Tax=Actinospica sp. TaxID=1872142 RepID=UPI002BD5A62C|nr:hypothetical protein [Actinospica sp.]HWG22593.1 hypothetical protein [Actinospica sp.]